MATGEIELNIKNLNQLNWNIISDVLNRRNFFDEIPIEQKNLSKLFTDKQGIEYITTLFTIRSVLILRSDNLAVPNQKSSVTDSMLSSLMNSGLYSFS